MNDIRPLHKLIEYRMKLKLDPNTQKQDPSHDEDLVCIKYMIKTFETELSRKIRDIRYLDLDTEDGKNEVQSKLDELDNLGMTLLNAIDGIISNYRIDSTSVPETCTIMEDIILKRNND